MPVPVRRRRRRGDRGRAALFTRERVGAVPAGPQAVRPGHPVPLSFPRPGWTLARGPARRAPTSGVLDELDERVVAAGGRVYLAKDGRVRPGLVAAMYPGWTLAAAAGRAGPRQVFARTSRGRLGLYVRRSSAPPSPCSSSERPPTSRRRSPGSPADRCAGWCWPADRAPGATRPSRSAVAAGVPTVGVDRRLDTAAQAAATSARCSPAVTSTSSCSPSACWRPPRPWRRPAPQRPASWRPTSPGRCQHWRSRAELAGAGTRHPGRAVVGRGRAGAPLQLPLRRPPRPAWTPSRAAWARTCAAPG